jgi:hypothetical protein
LSPFNAATATFALNAAVWFLLGLLITALLLRAFLTPIRAGSPLIGQSYFAEPLLFTETETGIRVISFRKANTREANRHGKPQTID